MKSEPKYQLTVSITSETKESLKEHLQKLLEDLDGSYGKPCQGTRVHHNSEVKITTPVWNGQPY